MIVLHRRSSTTRGDGTQGGHIAEHLRQRNHSLDDTSTATSLVHTLNQTTTLVQVADNVTHVLLRRNNLYAHDRLHEDRTSHRAELLEGLVSDQLEGELIGVDRVEATVGERDLQTRHREATEHTIGEAVAEALLNRGDKLLRHVTTLDDIDKLQVALLEVLILRFDGDVDTSELTTTTRLLLEGLAALSGT